MAINTREQMTPREVVEMEQDEKMWKLQAEHLKEMKRMEIEVMKLEAKVSSWLKLPLVIIKLPVFVLFGVGYIVHAIRKTEPSENFWKLLK